MKPRMNPINKILYSFLWLWSRILWRVFVFCCSKLFNQVIIDTDDNNIVIAVTCRNRFKNEMEEK